MDRITSVVENLEIVVTEVEGPETVEKDDLVRVEAEGLQLVATQVEELQSCKLRERVDTEDRNNV